MIHEIGRTGRLAENAGLDTQRPIAVEVAAGIEPRLVEARSQFLPNCVDQTGLYDTSDHDGTVMPKRFHNASCLGRPVKIG